MNRSKIKTAVGQLLVGGCIGILWGYYLIEIDLRMGWSFMVFLYLLLFAVLSYILHIALHEMGHCICGLVSGYQFVSYRIGSYMWVQENGRLVFRRFWLKGTGGQCLMAPPKNEKKPFILYNIGGGLMNLLVALLFFLLMLVLKDHLFYIFGTMMVTMGLLGAFSNLIPFDMGVPNDGYNLLSILREPQSVDSLYRQLLISRELSNGKCPSKLSMELIQLYEGADLKNPLNTYLALLQAERLMSEGYYEEAEKRLKTLREMNISESFKRCAEIDLITLLLIMGASQTEVTHYFRGKFKKAAEKNRSEVSTLMMMYGIDLLINHDEAKALADLKYYEDAKKKYPYRGVIEDLDKIKKLLDERKMCNDES